MEQTKTNKGFTLEMKVLLSVGLALFLAIGANTFIHVQDLKKNYLEAIEWRSVTLAQSLGAEISSKYDLFSATADHQLLLATAFLDCEKLYQANRDMHVSFVSVINEGHVIVAHNEKALWNKKLESPKLLAALKKQEIQMILEKEFYHTLIPIMAGGNNYLGTIDVGFPKQVVDEKILDAFFQGMFLFFILVSVAFLPVWIFVKRFVTIPIVQIVEATSAISNGDLEKQINIIQSSEFKTLSISLMNMRDAIRDNIATLSNKNHELKNEILIRKKTEQEKLQLESRLIQSQKMESIGTLAGGVAHEINNPINGIMNYAQLIKDKVGEDRQLIEYAGEIIHETERVAKIVKNLLTFAREDKEAHSPARIEDILNAVLSLIRTIIGKDQIQIEINIPKDLPKLKCRSQQIQQVLMNLMTNARDALNERYPKYDENKKILVYSRLYQKDGRRWICTTVEDHGIGVDPGIKNNLFDPFFTSKPRAVGTGLGLSISYGIVKAHHGELSVESTYGEYTKFHMDLPVDNGWKV